MAVANNGEGKGRKIKGNNNMGMISSRKLVTNHKVLSFKSKRDFFKLISAANIPITSMESGIVIFPMLLSRLDTILGH